jgi:hypothetical protein
MKDRTPIKLLTIQNAIDGLLFKVDIHDLGNISTTFHYYILFDS